MIKRIIGIVASLAIVTLIVFVVLGRGSYKSMLPDNIFSGRAIVGQLQEQSQGQLQEANNGEEEVVELADSIVAEGSIVSGAAEEEFFDKTEITAESSEKMADDE